MIVTEKTRYTHLVLFQNTRGTDSCLLMVAASLLVGTVVQLWIGFILEAFII